MNSIKHSRVEQNLGNQDIRYVANSFKSFLTRSKIFSTQKS